MSQRTLIERIEVLEQVVTKLSELPADVAALRLEFSQFREENQREHLAMRREMQEGFATVRAELRTEFRTEIRAGIEEAKRHALVLHEHLVDLIKTIRNG